MENLDQVWIETNRDFMISVKKFRIALKSDLSLAKKVSKAILSDVTFYKSYLFLSETTGRCFASDKNGQHL